MLKCEFHSHAKEDKLDQKITYSYKDLFKIYNKFKYNFVALTFHSKVFFNSDVKYYAKKYNIITCPAAEANINGCDILIYNITENELKKIKDFDDCKDYFCIAPHPFYPFHSLKENAHKFRHIFNAIELSSAHAPFLNYWNNKAKEFATKNNLPLVATGDTHHLFQINKSFTMVDSSENIDNIFNAIKKKRINSIQTRGNYMDLIKFALSDIQEKIRYGSKR
ncbi:MAG: PHP-associated domain-containing protein [Candidatus Woesearchaeota archaeon]|jgi:predicted metal-dependent phosphoesterase TrpH